MQKNKKIKRNCLLRCHMLLESETFQNIHHISLYRICVVVCVYVRVCMWEGGGGYEN